MKVQVCVCQTTPAGEVAYTDRYVSFNMLSVNSRGAIVRRAKQEIGWAGKRCFRVDYEDRTELRPHGESLVAIVGVGRGN